MKKTIAKVAGAALLLSALGYAGYSYIDSIRYVTTDDARIDADMIKVGPEIAGRVMEIRVKEGDLVQAGETMVRLEEKNTTLQNRDSALVRSPGTGLVMKKTVNDGELVSPGQRLFLLADFQHLYVSARIEETKIHRLAVGEPVTLTVDAFPGQELKGVVEQVGYAADSVFSLLPSSNVSGNFIKVTQRIPVKIKILDDQGLRILPGMNVIAKISTGG
ncbi:HlyD family efflux transporter periplasmic adaptor subunit [Heliobacterium gestii]|uniref:HlyD family efflux transporter periplasmic adaptor subunit n=1 Tax=Heliomicrobium gestii TaxID=2699 RepID=A0A845LFF7_HELGE|nr:efflux RND transporter periplasmic adaptor subunit [Heliomicrobium gestii]MBM7867849.1 multidrug resistance efflux pump [Heliomicrobium gestii]MZP43339.1 HlyD family efflux transporter periplasmic adaptor subunit [Heliomicrobium gestii]